VVTTRVPVRAPKPLEFTAIVKASALVTVALHTPLIGVPLPVAPVIITKGWKILPLAKSPKLWAVAVNDTAAALLAADTTIVLVPT